GGDGEEGGRGRPPAKLAEPRGVSRPPGRDQPDSRAELYGDGAPRRPSPRGLARARRRRRVLHLTRRDPRPRDRVGVRALPRAARGRRGALRHQADDHRGHRPGAVGARGRWGVRPGPPAVAGIVPAAAAFAGVDELALLAIAGGGGAAMAWAKGRPRPSPIALVFPAAPAAAVGASAFSLGVLFLTF